MKKSVDRPDQRYAFFLGAGSSVSSGIPTAGRLVRDQASHSDWLRRLRDLRSPDTADHRLDEWARKELSAWNPDNPGSSYGELIEKLFLTQGDRQREIERICDEGHFRDDKQKPKKPFPNFGYAVLSSLMCQNDGRFNVALTTNFDDLLADAFFYFQEVRPLVIHHDSLAPFIRPTYSRPLLVKLHGDYRLAPRNTSAETESLQDIVSQRISTVLHDRGIIFMGYGGNDESIIAMMERLPDEAIPFGIYWISNTEPRGIFRPWLESRGAVWVESRDFDELMFRLRESFEIKDPGDERHKAVLRRYSETKEGLFVNIANRSAESIEDAKLKALLATVTSDLDSAEQLFIEAISKFEESAELLGKYALFLKNKRKDMDRAEEFYKRAIDADPKHARNLGNYALFLKSERRDMDRAEEFYKRAIDADPKYANALGNYALFLTSERRDLDRAEEFYKRAIDADPKHARNLGNYALFLKSERRDMDRAEEFYKRAIDADPKHAHNLGNYAFFLTSERRDLDRAEEFYKRAIDADPKHANYLGNYALFLEDERRDLDRAEEFYKRAIDADPKHARNLGNYALFLTSERRDMDRAEEFYKRAIDADPKHANALGNYALFLQNERRDLDRAEEFYKRAIDADPNDANTLGNYAGCVLSREANLESIKLLESALTLSPKNDSLAIELAFYSFAHCQKEKRDHWLAEVKQLITAGVRSPGWNLDPNVERAVKDGHPARSWLKKLASVISEGADVAILKNWKAWQRIDT